MNTTSKTKIPLTLLCLFVLSGCVVINIPREAFFFSSHFSKEISLFRPLMDANDLKRNRESKDHWDQYFEHSEVVALGIEKSWEEDEFDSKGNSIIERDGRVEWIWVKNRDNLKNISVGSTNIYIDIYDLQREQISATLGKGSVRLGRDKYPFVYSIMGNYHSGGPYDYRTILIIDAASSPPEL